MRALLVANRYPPAGAGGYERICAATARALRAASHDACVLTTRGGAADNTRDPAVRRELRWYAEPGGFATPPWRERLRLERANAAVLGAALDGVDVVCWWGMGGMSLSLIELARRAGVPAVGVVGDGWMAYGPQADAWTRGWARAPAPAAAAAAWATGVPTRLRLGAGARWLFIAEAVRERALAAGHELPDTGIAHPGVDPATFPPAAPAPHWGGRLAYVGRVEPRKGVAVALQALAGLPDAVLTVDGPVQDGYDAELRAAAATLGVSERVSFVRSAPDAVAAAYAAADAVLFPVTWAEPWGLVPLEAMAVGRPVVATGTGGSAEYLRDGENALVVAPGDADALAGAVRRLAGDAALRARLVAGGRATAARYSAAAFEAAVVAALEAAAAGGGGG